MGVSGGSIRCIGLRGGAGLAGAVLQSTAKDRLHRLNSHRTPPKFV